MSKKKAADDEEQPTADVLTEVGASGDPAIVDRIRARVAGIEDADAKLPVTAPPPPPRPSIGRIVIYTSTGEKGAAGEQHGAFITAVDAETVCLRVFTRTSDYVKVDIRQADDVPGSEEAQGRWAWPPRV